MRRQYSIRKRRKKKKASSAVHKTEKEQILNSAILHSILI